jgi:hypothetical protein
MRLRFLMLCLLLATIPAVAPIRAADQTPITLVAQPPLGAGMAAFPRLTPGDGQAVQRINKALTDADERLRSAARDCRSEAQEAQADPKDTSWQRDVRVAMRGAGYLALVASDNWYCGGAYPDVSSFALAYDLRTGAPLNWERLLPKSLAGTATLDSAGDGTKLGVVASPALKALYVKLAKPDADCASALQDIDLQFILWPDAERWGVAMEPSGLPHAIIACGPDVVIPMSMLHSLGVQAPLLEAIAAAHQAGLYGPSR